MDNQVWYSCDWYVLKIGANKVHPGFRKIGASDGRNENNFRAIPA